jgi:beta-glucosidase-like glycosyl hydrolase
MQGQLNSQEFFFLILFNLHNKTESRKGIHGLLFVMVKAPVDQIPSFYQEHRELAREAVRKSLVLLKNGKSEPAGPLLPLAKKVPKILVAGSHADNLGYQCGGWTIEWQGIGGNNLTAGT